MGIRRARYFDQSEPDKFDHSQPWETRSRVSRSTHRPATRTASRPGRIPCWPSTSSTNQGHPTRAALDRVLSFQRERLHTYLTQDRPPWLRGSVRLSFWMRLSALLHRERHRLQGGPGLLVARVDPPQDRLAGEIGRAFFGRLLDVDHAYVTDQGVVHDVIPVLFLPDRGVGGQLFVDFLQDADETGVALGGVAVGFQFVLQEYFEHPAHHLLDVGGPRRGTGEDIDHEDRHRFRLTLSQVADDRFQRGVIGQAAVPEGAVVDNRPRESSREAPAGQHVLHIERRGVTVAEVLGFTVFHPARGHD